MSGGQNAPWGASSYGTPSAPQLYTDPTQFATPGMNAEIQNVRTQAGAQQGSANNAAMAAMQRAGVAGGGEMSSALGNIAGQTQAATAGALSGLQNQQYQQQMGLMDALNQANLYNYGLQSKNDIANTQARYGQDQQVGSEASNLIGSLIKAIAS